MKNILLIFVLLILLGGCTKKAAVREHVLLEEIDVKSIAVLPLEFSSDFIPRNQQDCEYLKNQWDINFSQIFHEEFQAREEVEILFPGTDYDSEVLKNLSPEEIIDKLQVDGLLKYKVYDYKDYEKITSMVLLGVEVVLNTLYYAQALLTGEGGR